MAYAHQREHRSPWSYALGVRPMLVLLGLGVTLAFGYFAVRDVDVEAAWHAFRGSQAWWIIPSLVALGLAVVCRAIRWRYLFEPHPSLGAVLSAYLVGQFFNSILPLRAGEAARLVAVSRRSGTSRAQAAATIVVERVLDVFWLLVMLIVLVPWLPQVSWLGAAAAVALALGVVVVTIAIVLRLYGEQPFRLMLVPLRVLPGFPTQRIETVAGNLTRGLACVRGMRSFLIASFLTVLSWLVLAASFWLLALAFNLPHSPLLGVLVVVSTNVAQILPSAPAAVGVFEAATIVALLSYDVPQATALSYAVVLHALNLFPYLLAGPIALRFTPVAGLRRVGSQRDTRD